MLCYQTFFYEINNDTENTKLVCDSYCDWLSQYFLKAQTYRTLQGTNLPSLISFVFVNVSPPNEMFVVADAKYEPHQEQRDISHRKNISLSNIVTWYFILLKIVVSPLEFDTASTIFSCRLIFAHVSLTCLLKHQLTLFQEKTNGYKLNISLFNFDFQKLPTVTCSSNCYTLFTVMYNCCD